MSNARDERDWPKKNPEGESRAPDAVYSPAEEVGDMHFSSENFTTAIEYFHKALESTENFADQDKFRILLKICDCHRLKGNYDLAEEAVDAAGELAEKSASEAILAKVEYRRAYLLLTRGRYDDALRSSFNAYRKLKNSDEHQDVASVQNLIAHCYLRLGLMGEAEEFFQDALSSFRRIEDRVGIAYALNNLGLVHKNACRWNRALASLSKSLEIAKALGLAQHIIRVQLNLGVVYAKLRRFPEAITSFGTAAATAERFGDRVRLTKALNIQGRTYVQAGDTAKAEKLILRAQTLATEVGYVRESALADENLGEMMMARRKYREAVANLSNALKLARKIAPEGDIAAECLRRLAEAKYHMNRPQAALEHIEEGLEVARKCGEFYELGYFYRTRGLCHSRLGNAEAAVKDVEKSIETFQRYGNPFEKAHSLRVLGRLFARRGDEAHLLKARNVLSESVVEFGKLDEGREQIFSYAVLATVDIRLGNMDDALLSVYEAHRLVEEEHDQKFRKALLALRNKIERHMSRATTNVIDQFSVLGDIQSGARSREQLVKGLGSTLKLILERLSAHAGFVAIPSASGKNLQVATRDSMPRAEAQAILAWYSKSNRKDKSFRSGMLVTDVQNRPDVAALRDKLDDATGTLLVQALGFEGEDLGVLCVRQQFDSARPPMGQDALDFVGAYSSLISLSVYEIVRSERRSQTRTKSTSKGFQSIVTENEEMIKLLNLSERVAHSDATVLLQGETGTGKGLIAYAVHLLSDRRDRKFVHVNCAALPEQLLESELFGHVRGAFTGAFADKEGLLLEAHGGTVFLDEIGKTSLAMQGKLLQFLDTGKVRKVGSNELKPVNVRVVCASKSNLLQKCEEGSFLEDFFYRINDFPLTVPPLRDRPEDIELLMHHYVDKYSREMGKNVDGVADEFLEKLLAYRWPGNVRELEKVIKRALIMADEDDKLSLHHLAPEVADPSEAADVSEAADERLTLKQRIEQIEQAEILEALKRNAWNKSQAAIHLGISYPNLLSKIKRYNIQ
jgi:transcriptional regulator with GAF, ATPase, and Fis domain